MLIEVWNHLFIFITSRSTCCILIYRFNYTCRIHFDAIIKTLEDFLKKIYLSLYCMVCVWEGVGNWTKTATHWLPQPLRASPCVVLVLLDYSTGAWGPSLSGICSHSSIFSLTSGLQTQSGVPRAPSAGLWLSLPQLYSNSLDLQLTDFLSTPSYIIVQSPTQSLEWHVWSTSSGNNNHAVHRSLSSGVSVYGNLLSFLLRCGTRPYERGTQWDSNSLV